MFLLYFTVCLSNSASSQSIESAAIKSIVTSNAKSLDSIKYDSYYLLKIDSLFQNKNVILNSGIITKKLVNDSYIVFLDSVAIDNINQYEKNISLYAINYQWKKSLNITNNDNEYLNGEYWIKITDNLKWNNFLSKTSKINTISKIGNYLKIIVTDVRLDDILNKNFITYIEKVAESVKNEARVLDLNLHPNRINTIHAYWPDVNGSNEVVSVKEPFYNISDIDLSGRYLQTNRESEFSDRHSLEMATIIAGNGNSFLTGLGVATNAGHTSSSNQEVIPDPAEYFSSNAIEVQNHSYGTSIESFYGVAASLYDQQVYDNPEILHVFSIGNAGLESSAHGRYEGINGFSTITGNFKQAKNVLTIGAVDTSMNVIELNSNGPAFDGRIKPELVAYSMTGTSNSAALVSGVSILLQQAFRKTNSTELSASLKKAFLINSADKIGDPGPSHKTGYGSLNAYQALKSLNSNQFLEEQLKEGEKKFTINIPDNAFNFKATLVWTDPPAAPNDEIALVHDLNLHAEDGLGYIYLPWVLETVPNIDALNAPATKGIDHLNNIEQLSIEMLDSDSLEIIVSVENSLAVPQNFSIVYSWEIQNEFEWTSPTFKDNIPYNGETASHLRWENSYSSEMTGNLYYKLLREDNWQLIEENILLENENFRWDPEIVNDFAQLKMEIGNHQYVSDTFSISEPLRLNVGFNCTDSLSFYWESRANADEYRLYHLENHQMKILSTTQDTSVTVDKSTLESSFLKVQAFQNGKPLITGVAIDYNLQGSNCFLESYFVESIQGEGIYHDLQLSSLSGVESVSFEKRNETTNQWEKLSELEADSFDFRYLEGRPINGFNFSRVVIDFVNGESIISDVQSTYYVASSDYILYPNPIKKEEELKIFAKKFIPDSEIIFYNSQGLELFSTDLESDRNFLDFDFVKAGIYFYRIYTSEKTLASGKILVQD